MYRKTVVMILSVLSFFAVAGVQAGEGAGEGKGGGKAGMGKVVSVDATANTITIKKSKAGEPKTFTLGTGATITIDGKPGTLTQITEGQRVKITGTPESATSVEVTTSSVGSSEGGKKEKGEKEAGS
jgi:hypothetical protein